MCRKGGLEHGNLAARLLREETGCFAFLAGHESFAAAEEAIKIAEMAYCVRKTPLRVILNGLGKDAANWDGNTFRWPRAEVLAGHCIRTTWLQIPPSTA